METGGILLSPTRERYQGERVHISMLIDGERELAMLWHQQPRL